MTSPAAQPSVWHAGETALHKAFGVEEKMQARGRAVIRTYMPAQHRAFFETLGFVVLSALDGEGRVWPFLRAGPPGFMRSPAPARLAIRAQPLPGEPADLLLGDGAKISVLGIELDTKRRNRMNGTIRTAGDGALRIEVDQSFGNCPRYITARERLAFDPAPPGEVTHAAALGTDDRQQIGRADTLFIASRVPELGADRHAGVDVNHRGGPPGFVRIIDARTLVIPDYQGNLFFNTLGNLLRDPRCGLLFPDFERGDLLTLTGTAEVVLDDTGAEALCGAERYLRFRVARLHRAARVFPLRHRRLDPAQTSAGSPP